MAKLTPTIIQESPHYLALHKPAGLVSDQQWDYPSVEGWVHNYLQEKGVKKPYVGMVHRLDRVTSGLLLVAKKKSSLRKLQEQFRERTVRKFYLALVENQPTVASGELRHHLEKDQAGKRAIIYQQPTTNTQPAHLSYRTLSQEDNRFLLEIELHTGRFHQIRAQLSAIGCPIVGDQKYGASTHYGEHAIALHAHRLVFHDPQTGKRTALESKANFQ